MNPVAPVGRPRALLSMREGLAPRLFDEDARRRLESAYDIHVDAPPVTDFGEVPDGVMQEVVLLVTGWGSARVDAAVLDRTPNLAAVVHAAGSVKGHVAVECWERGVQVSSAASANAVPVAEYVSAMVLLCAKQVFRAQALYRTRRQWVDPLSELPSAGAYRRPVGIVGASRIGRQVLALLGRHDLDLRLHDPTVTDAEARRLGATRVGLDALLGECDVVSLHAPLLPSTRHLVGPRELALLPDGATLINTARGGLVEHDALVAELVSGRIWAVLDVTDPYEPLEPTSPLHDLANVVLTPHWAGAVGNELRRLGDHAVEDAIRLARGDRLLGGIDLTDLPRMA